MAPGPPRKPNHGQADCLEEPRRVEILPRESVVDQPGSPALDLPPLSYTFSDVGSSGLRGPASKMYPLGPQSAALLPPFRSGLLVQWTRFVSTSSTVRCAWRGPSTPATGPALRARSASLTSPGEGGSIR